MSTITMPVKVFYSYADTDEELLDELEKHLSLLCREGLITTWHKRKIIAGSDWTQALDHHLSTASIFLLLISSDFMASDYCYGKEMQHALLRSNVNEARVIPLLLRPVDWQNAPFGMLKALPSNRIPITQWQNRDEAFTDVAKGLRGVLEDIQSLTVSLPQSPFPHIWMIPHFHNHFFTGREELLTQLSTALHSDHAALSPKPQALNGLGGIGKTQIAVEYAYQHRQDYQAVFWTRADSHETLISGYVAIAKQLKLSQQDNQDQTITVQAVVQWLTSHSEWLLILDGADDLALVREFLPSMFGGHIVLTTRTQAMGLLAQRIEVQTMDPDIGALFLLRRANLVAHNALLEKTLSLESQRAREIAEELGGLPLALDQAGAYIEETRCSLSDYQDLYRTRRTQLLKERGGIIDDHPEPVATTWALNFEKVEQESPVATELLRFCAFLYPEAIPEEILFVGSRHLGPLLRTIDNDLWILNKAIAALGTYSLLQRDALNKTLSIHQLVQVVLKDAMSEVTQSTWRQRAIQAINSVFPVVEFATWSQCERYLSHALICTSMLEQENQTLDAASLLNRIGWYLIERVRYREAEPLLIRALAIRELQAGPEHPDTASSLNNLAELYHSQGKYKQAEPLLIRALAIGEKVLGPEHFETGTALNNLALLYELQGKHEQVESLHVQAIVIREKQVGSDHPFTAQSLNNLAVFYRIRGKYEQAEPLFQRALDIDERRLGPEHPDTGTILCNLADLYREQSKYKQAELLYQRALAIRKKQLGLEHPDTATSLNNFAHLYVKQGKNEQAESLFIQALSIREQLLGPEHPDTSSSLNDLAALYYNQGKYEQAEPLYLRALAIREQQSGSIHLDTATSFNNLAALYYNQGKYEQAEPLYLRALAIRELQVGLEHPFTAQILNNLAGVYRAQGKHEQAKSLLLHALTIYEQQLGPEHSETGTTLGNLAEFYGSQGMYEQAEIFYQRTLAIREKQLGFEHPFTIQILNNLALLYDSQGKYEQAEPLFQHVLTLKEQMLGSEDADIASHLNNLGLLYYHQEKYEQAEPFYQRALTICEQQLGLHHPKTAATLNNLALIYTNQRKYEQAESFYQRALIICEQQVEREYPLIISCLSNMVGLYTLQDQYEQAEPICMRTLMICKYILGQDHPQTKVARDNYTSLLHLMSHKAEAIQEEM